MKSLSKLHESIHILNVLHNKLINYTEAVFTIHSINGVDTETLSDLNQMAFEWGMTTINSILKEFEGPFYSLIDQGAKETVDQYFAVIKKEISQYKHINKYRNNISAHELRIPEGNIYFHGSLRKYRIPQSIEEFRYLAYLIQMLIFTINTYYPGMYKEACDLVTKRINNDPTPYQTGMSLAEVEQKSKAITQRLIDLAEASKKKDQL